MNTVIVVAESHVSGYSWAFEYGDPEIEYMVVSSRDELEAAMDDHDGQDFGLIVLDEATEIARGVEGR